MQIIKHRQNSRFDHVNKKIISGVEIDVRIHNSNIILSHDPFQNGIRLEEWVKDYDLELLIVNVKEEGLEDYIIKIFQNAKIHNYFILDETVPFIIKYCNKGFSNFALRVSKWESLSSALKIARSLKFKPHWIWLDTFNGKIPVNTYQIKTLKDMNIKTCLVSPELHPDYSDTFPSNKFIKQYLNFGEGIFDSVCTKQEGFWYNLLKNKF